MITSSLFPTFSNFGEGSLSSLSSWGSKALCWGHQHWLPSAAHSLTLHLLQDQEREPVLSLLPNYYSYILTSTSAPLRFLPSGDPSLSSEVAWSLCTIHSWLAPGSVSFVIPHPTPTCELLPPQGDESSPELPHLLYSNHLNSIWPRFLPVLLHPVFWPSWTFQFFKHTNAFSNNCETSHCCSLHLYSASL